MTTASQTHKELFCRSFLESYKAYMPEELPWPDLDQLSLQRLRAIPFWAEALHTEREAGAMVNAYATTVNDPLVREVIALQGWEENRHACVLKFVLTHYAIAVPERPVEPLPSAETIEPAFMSFGYGECLDSFLAFGMFKLARQSGFLPESLFSIFDLVMEEEARHIMFFVNWIAYQSASQGRGATVFRVPRALWYYGKALHKLRRAMRAGDVGGEGFVATGASTFIEHLTPELVLSACLAENHRRMSRFDKALLQPRFVPTLATIALRSLKLLPWNRSRTANEPYP